MFEIKFNKTNLNKIIKYSSSRYNSWNKADTIKWVMKCLKDGFFKYGDKKSNYITISSGSYCESGSLRNTGEYYIDLEKKIVKEVSFNNNNEVEKVYQEWKLI